MRWDAVPKSNPSHGAKRKISEYAWLPTLVENKYVWLEEYWSWQEFWATGQEWVEIQRYLK